jgi:hypothetical protein
MIFELIIMFELNGVFSETIGKLDDVSRDRRGLQELKELGMSLQEDRVVNDYQYVICIDG